MLTDAPSMEAPVAALTTPDTVAVSVGPAGPPFPHAGARSVITRAIGRMWSQAECRMKLSCSGGEAINARVRQPRFCAFYPLSGFETGSRRCRRSHGTPRPTSSMPLVDHRDFHPPDVDLWKGRFGAG